MEPASGIFICLTPLIDSHRALFPSRLQKKSCDIDLAGAQFNALRGGQ